jgi:hypothetical protein
LTLDSVKDHTMTSQSVEMSVTESSTATRLERTEVRQVTSESVTVTKTVTNGADKSGEAF